MKKALLSLLLLYSTIITKADPCQISSAYLTATNVTFNQNGTCNITFNISLNLTINSGSKWINLDITSPAVYSASVSLSGYSSGTQLITPFTNITINNINCSSFIQNGITANIGISNSSSNNHDQCYSSGASIPLIGLGVLAVKFNSFNAQAINNKPVITWSTATESNVKGFIIQQKINNGSFADIATIPSTSAGGNSSNEIKYNYTIPEELNGSMYYYRIVTLGNAGQKEYSDIKSLKGKNADISFFFSPNPCFGSTKIILPSNIGAVNAFVYDISGREIKQFRNITDQTITLNGITKGNYFVKVESITDNTSVTEKLVVF